MAPSLKVPVAANCWFLPTGIEGIAGVTAIDSRIAAVTVRSVDAVIAPDAAWIVVVPSETPVAWPAASIVATLVADDVHVTDAVRSCVLPSVYVPVAVTATVLPIGVDGLTGVTSIETSVAAPTVAVV